MSPQFRSSLCSLKVSLQVAYNHHSSFIWLHERQRKYSRTARKQHISLVGCYETKCSAVVKIYSSALSARRAKWLQHMKWMFSLCGCSAGSLPWIPRICHSWAPLLPEEPSFSKLIPEIETSWDFKELEESLAIWLGSSLVSINRGHLKCIVSEAPAAVPG